VRELAELGGRVARVRLSGRAGRRLSGRVRSGNLPNDRRLTPALFSRGMLWAPEGDSSPCTELMEELSRLMRDLIELLNMALGASLELRVVVSGSLPKDPGSLARAC